MAVSDAYHTRHLIHPVQCFLERLIIVLYSVKTWRFKNTKKVQVLQPVKINEICGTHLHVRAVYSCTGVPFIPIHVNWAQGLHRHSRSSQFDMQVGALSVPCHPVAVRFI